MQVTVVIPAFNEEARLPSTLKKISRETRFNILVVDDNSTDRTAQIAKQHGARVIRNTGPKGKGSAVKLGLQACHTNYMVICDADLPIGINDLNNLVNLCVDYDIVIASRHQEESIVTRSKLREILSKGFNWYIRMVFPLPYRDTQCGIKVMNLKSARQIAPSLKEPGFLFDLELLLLAFKLGLKVKEVGVKWEEKSGSKINLIKDPIKMFIGALKLRKKFS